MAESVSLDKILSRVWGQVAIDIPVQLTTTRVGNHTDAFHIPLKLLKSQISVDR